jgi:predicted nucleic acid-binding protein
MRVCIDTNVLVQLFGWNQVGRSIRDALLTGRIELAISNEILFGSGYKPRPITPQEFIQAHL